MVKENISSWSTIVGTTSSIIATIAALAAAYFSYKAFPKKVKEVALEIKNIIARNEENEWIIEFNFANLDKYLVLQEAIVVIETGDIDLIRSVPYKNAAGLSEIPDINFDDKKFNLTVDRMKPTTKQKFNILIKAKPDNYNLDWYAYGQNLKEKKGKIELNLM